MKRLVHFCLYGAAFYCRAQNLIPNPGFEQYSNCPTAAAQIYYSTYWYQPASVFGMNVNISSSSDYFNQCATLSSNVSVPNNAAGYQPARTGNAYAGIVCFLWGTDYREYVATSLTNPLVSGKRYCISFYVNLANISKYAIGSLGAFLSTDSSIYNATGFYTHLPVVPQVENNPNVYITDTSAWVPISGNYIAQGGEKFIVIGNFRDSVSTPSQIFNASQISTIAYYFIEDVSVTCCDPLGCVDLTSNLNPVSNIFTPNNDGINDVFKITGKNLTDFKLNIYNRWGTLVYSFISPNDAWDGRNTSGEPCSSGVYFYFLSAKGTDGKEYSEKGSLQLLR